MSEEELPQEALEAEEGGEPEQTDTSDGEVIEDFSGQPLPGSASDG